MAVELLSLDICKTSNTYSYQRKKGERKTTFIPSFFSSDLKCCRVFSNFDDHQATNFSLGLLISVVNEKRHWCDKRPEAKVKILVIEQLHIKGLAKGQHILIKKYHKTLYCKNSEYDFSLTFSPSLEWKINTLTLQDLNLSICLK